MTKCRYSTPVIADKNLFVKGESYRTGTFGDVDAYQHFDPKEKEVDGIVRQVRNRQTGDNWPMCDTDPFNVRIDLIPYIDRHKGYAAWLCPVCSRIQDDDIDAGASMVDSEWFNLYDWDQVSFGSYTVELFTVLITSAGFQKHLQILFKDAQSPKPGFEYAGKDFHVRCTLPEDTPQERIDEKIRIAVEKMHIRKQ